MSEMTKAEFASPKISAVRPVDGDYVLEVTWASGTVSRVDLAEVIFRLKHLRPLRKVDRFKLAKVGEWGWSVSWGDDLELSGEMIWEKAKEQEQASMTASDFRAWLDRLKLTQERAASLLGISKRLASYYATGSLPVTRVVALALNGLQQELEGEARAPFEAALETATAVLADEATGGKDRIAESIYEQIKTALQTQSSLFQMTDEYKATIVKAFDSSFDASLSWTQRNQTYFNLAQEGARHVMLRSLLSATREMKAEEYRHTLGRVVALHFSEQSSGPKKTLISISKAIGARRRWARDSEP